MLYHLNHIIRLCILLIVIGVCFIIVRGFFVPESFGTYGSYTYGYHRGESDAEQENLYALYQETKKCAKCHEEQADEKDSGSHATVACETCHGYWQAHNENTKDKVPRDTSNEFCMNCHTRLTGRPDDFPQVVSFQQHMKDEETEFDPEATCIDCHDPHVPEDVEDTSSTDILDFSTNPNSITFESTNSE